MSLVNCLECGNKISDSAAACPNCGFPMQEYISFVKSEKEKIQAEEKRIAAEKEKERQRIIEQERIANTRCYECGNVIGDIDVCPYCGFDMVSYKRTKEEQEQNIRDMRSRQSNINNRPITSIVRCPKCGSTQIQMVNRKYSLLTGFATNKVDRVCVNCKYKW